MVSARCASSGSAHTEPNRPKWVCAGANVKSTSQAVSPVQKSRWPLQPVVITGSPESIASANGSPNPSARLGATSAWHCSISPFSWASPRSSSMMATSGKAGLSRRASASQARTALCGLAKVLITKVTSSAAVNARP